MPLDYDHTAPKRATNVSLNTDLLAKARDLGINISQACEAGLARQISDIEGKKWLAENANALRSSNEYAEKHGLPLDRFRKF